MKNTLLLLSALFICVSSTACNDKSRTVRGNINLKSGLQSKLQPTAVLYVIARQEGTQGGPPLAVRRFTQPFNFPIQFTITQEDTMVPNSPFEGKVAITARIAQGGAATPALPGDIEGAMPAVSEVGGGAVEIDLTVVR